MQESPRPSKPVSKKGSSDMRVPEKNGPTVIEYAAAGGTSAGLAIEICLWVLHMTWEMKCLWLLIATALFIFAAQVLPWVRRGSVLRKILVSFSVFLAMCIIGFPSVKEQWNTDHVSSEKTQPYATTVSALNVPSNNESPKRVVLTVENGSDIQMNNNTGIATVNQGGGTNTINNFGTPPHYPQ